MNRDTPEYLAVPWTEVGAIARDKGIAAQADDGARSGRKCGGNRSRESRIAKKKFWLLRMRVILDTNVVLSAFIRGDSNPYKIVQGWIDGRFELQAT